MKASVKPIAALCAALLLAGTLLSGCSDGTETSSAASVPSTSSQAEKTKVNVYGLKGPTGIGLVNLWKAGEDGTALNDYKVEALASPDDAVAKISNKEADIAAIPTNLAATLYQKTGGTIQVLAVNTLGVLHIVENGDTIQKVSDLKGKTIYSTGQGSNPEYVLNYVLRENGLDPEKDVTVKFVTENDELATKLATGEAEIAMVPEPVVTTTLSKNADLRVALDMTKEWEAVAGDKSALMMGCVVGRKEFIEQNPQAVKDFLTEYKASVEKALDDIDGTAALCETYGIIPKAAVAKQAIPRCNLTYVDGADMKEQLGGYLKVLFDADPKSVGGTMPDDNFYYLG